MTSRAKKAVVQPPKNHANKPISRLSQPVARPLPIVRAIRDAKTARKWLSYSLHDVTHGLLKATGRDIPHNTLATWEARGTPLGRDIMVWYAHRIIDQVKLATGRVVGVKIETNSPWQVWLYGECRQCGKWFRLRRLRDDRCPRHAPHQRSR